MIRATDERVQEREKPKPPQKRDEITTPASMFFAHNPELGPPYRVLCDTNFIVHSGGGKLDLFDSMQQCLLAPFHPYVTDCCIGELEAMGRRYHMALRVVRDPRFRHITCGCRGNYGDDCIVATVSHHRCFIVATNDKDLRRRLRKIPGVPIMILHKGRFCVERLPDSVGQQVPW